MLDEALPGRRGLHSKRRLQPKIDITPEQKREAVVDLGSRDGPAREVAEKYGVTRAALYKWKNVLLGKEPPLRTRKRKESKLSNDKDALLAKMESLKEVGALEKQVHRLQLERDVLEVTAEILKKARAPIQRS